MNLFEITGFIANIHIIVISTWLIVKYLSIKIYMNKYMDIDKLLDNLEELEQPTVEEQVDLQGHRERLIGVAASGNSKLYLGKNISVSEIEALDDKELLKLYSRYEVYIGSVMTKSLKSTICCAYTTLVSTLVPSISRGKCILVEADKLSESLIENPVINLALSTYTCKLYHDYGHLLAPLTAGLLTSGHIKSIEITPSVVEHAESISE